MMPHDIRQFKPAIQADWLVADEQWFKLLSSARVFTLAEKIHLARLAIQQQWVCDIQDTTKSREWIVRLGLHVATTTNGYLIVSGSPAAGEFLKFRGTHLGLMETGILYGYPTTAVLGHARILPAASPNPWPETCAEYFIGGAYSTSFPANGGMASGP